MRRLALFVLTWAMACSGGGDGKKDDPAGAPAATPEVAPPAGPDASVPVDVAGSFLAGCSAATGPTYVNDSAISANLTACVVRDKEGKEVAIATPSVTVTTAATMVSPTLVTKETSHAWSVGFTTPPELLATLREIRIAFKTADGKEGVAVTDNAAFDWSTDPAFIGATQFVQLIHEVATPANKFDETGALADLNIQSVPYHVFFLTDALYRGDVGEAGADAACDAAGQTFDKGARFVAVMSTSQRAAKDKIVLAGHVYTFAGAGMSLDTGFWNFTWYKQPVTDSGLSIEKRVVKGETPPFFMLQAWTGTSKGGGLDPAGTCNDWSTASADARGFAWYPSEEKGSKYGDKNAAAPCSRRARLACISLWPRGR